MGAEAIWKLGFEWNETGKSEIQGSFDSALCAFAQDDDGKEHGSVAGRDGASGCILLLGVL